MSMFDLDRVEVLRGPQGTLFGRNATGGRCSSITTKPGKDFDAYVDLTGGSYGSSRPPQPWGPLTDRIQPSGHFAIEPNTDGIF